MATSIIADETLKFSRNFLKILFCFVFWFSELKIQLMNKLKGHFSPALFFLLKNIHFLDLLNWYFLEINYRNVNL